MRQRDIISLIIKYLEEKASEGEVILVDKWYASFNVKLGMINQMNDAEVKAAAHKSFIDILSSFSE